MIWSGKTVAIMASGPSMTPAIVEAVRAAGLIAIVINDTWRRMPDAAVMLASDTKWWLARDPRLSPGPDEFGGERLTCQQDPRVKDVRYVVPAYPEGTDGNNSALHATNEARRRGAACALLFGVDLRDDDLNHWHPSHVGVNNKPTAPRFARMRRLWGQFARQLNGFEVINCNPESGLGCFPKEPAADVFQMLEFDRAVAA